MGYKLYFSHTLFFRRGEDIDFLPPFFFLNYFSARYISAAFTQKNRAWQPKFFFFYTVVGHIQKSSNFFFIIPSEQIQARQFEIAITKTYSIDGSVHTWRMKIDFKRTLGFSPYDGEKEIHEFTISRTEKVLLF